MNEHSYFHNGAARGDAVEAPYSDELYAKLRSIFLTSLRSGVFGTAAVPDSYVVTPSAGMTISVAAGSAYIYGVVCNLTPGTTLTVPSNAHESPRMDRVVLRVVWGPTSSVTLSIKTGAPANIPLPPTLTQIPQEVFEISLARIYVPSGLAAVTADYIIDEREFFERSERYYSNDNLMPNSQFMAAVGTGYLNGSVANGYPPAYWTSVSGTTVIIDDKFDTMERGSSVLVGCPALNDGLQTTLPRLASTYDIPVTIRLWIDVIQGEVWIDTAGGGANGVRVPRTGGPIEVILRRTFGAADPDLELWVYNILTTQTVFRLGQVTVAHGLTGASKVSQREYIIFQKNVVHTGYDGVTTYSTGTSELNLEPAVRPGVEALYMQLHCGDVGSAGNSTVYAALQDPTNNANQLRLEIGRLTNSSFNAAQGFVGAPFDSTTRLQELQIEIAASGALQFVPIVRYLGCVT